MKHTVIAVAPTRRCGCHPTAYLQYRPSTSGFIRLGPAVRTAFKTKVVAAEEPSSKFGPEIRPLLLLGPGRRYRGNLNRILRAFLLITNPSPSATLSSAGDSSVHGAKGPLRFNDQLGCMGAPRCKSSLDRVVDGSVEHRLPLYTLPRASVLSLY